MPLTDVYGNKANLSSFRGKWVVVNYWATWCPPCIVEMPELQAFHDAHADGDAIVIGINTELIGKQQLLNFLDDYFITYPVFVSKPTQKSELGLIPGLPTTFLVSPDGEVVARQIGPVTREMIEQFIANWQPEQAATRAESGMQAQTTSQ
jgi:thiol-disulfide isomerase/thioredoxin